MPTMLPSVSTPHQSCHSGAGPADLPHAGQCRPGGEGHSRDPEEAAAGEAGGRWQGAGAWETHCHARWSQRCPLTLVKMHRWSCPSLVTPQTQWEPGLGRPSLVGSQRHALPCPFIVIAAPLPSIVTSKHSSSPDVRGPLTWFCTTCSGKPYFPLHPRLPLDRSVCSFFLKCALLTTSLHPPKPSTCRKPSLIASYRRVKGPPLCP